MSLRTRINGFTAWANFRLLEHDITDTNIIIDLLQGTTLKFLVQSLVGYKPKRLGSLNDITQNQIISRVEWAISELKGNNVIPASTDVDARMFAMRSADQIFDLLWKTITHDIHFLWDRQEFLKLKDNKKLCEVPLNWVPDIIPTRNLKQQQEIDDDDAMLMGFGNTAAATQVVQYESVPTDFVRYSGQNICLGYKPSSKRDKKRPSPEKCMLELIQSQLAATDEGKALGVKSLRDVGTCQVFCALLNSFVSDTFSNEILLADRWAFNLAISTFHRMTHLTTQVTSEDFVQVDTQSMCGFLTAVLLLMYKYRQCRAVVKRIGEVKMNIRRAELEIAKLGLGDEAELAKDAMRQHWELSLSGSRGELDSLTRLYDVTKCESWLKHVADVQRDTRAIIRAKMKDRFDAILVPQNMTVSELVESLGVNLSLTKGNGFVKMTTKEYVQADKRLVLRNTATGEYIDDFTGTVKEGFSVRKLLGYAAVISVEIKPENHPKYDIFLEAHCKQA